MRPTFRSLNDRAKSVLRGTTLLAGIGAAFVAVAPAFAADSDATGVETVVVTGYRASLTASTDAKRASTSFTDTIFAEDIGKFPDTDVAESLNRIPGVTINREDDGEGVQVSIRGLGTNFTKILLNNTPIAIATTGSTDANNNNREVDLNMFPTDLFTQLTVSKSPTADQIEGGVAGTVNMRSLRAFDNPGAHFTYNVQGSDYSAKDTQGERGTFIASDTWGEFGALVGVSLVHNKMFTKGWEDGNAGWYTPGALTAAQCGAGNTCDQVGGNMWAIPNTIPGLISNPAVAAVNIPVPGAPAGTYYAAGTTIDAAWLTANNPGVTTTQLSNMLLPRLGRSMYEMGSRDRGNAVASLEWRPTDSLHFYVDSVLGRSVNDMDRSDLDTGFRGGVGSQPLIPTNIKLDANLVPTSGTFYNATFFLEARPYKEKSDFFSINPGVSWDVTDLLHVDFQGNATRSHFFRDSPSILFVTAPSIGYPTGVTGAPAAPAGGVNFTWSDTGNYPIITPNIDLNNPANYSWYNGRVNVQNEHRYTYTDGLHLDTSYGGDFLTLKAGLAYDDVFRNISATDASQAWQNAICGDNPNVFIAGNSNPPCQGIVNANPNGPGGPGGYPTYPGLGTGYTNPANGWTGPTTLSYGGSLIPNAAVPSYLRPGPTGFVSVNYNKLLADSNYAYYDNLTIGAQNPQTLYGHPGEVTYPYSPTTVAGGGNSGQYQERVFGIYGEANGKFDIGGHALRYNLGLRWIETHEDIVSPVTDQTVALANAALTDGGKYPGRYSFGSAKSVYHSYLPSINAVYEVSDDFQVRASLSRTMSRPNPNQMVSGINFNDVLAQTATLGNPGLKPYYSNNIDIGAEYYTGGEGYIGFSAFHKSVTGFTTAGFYNTTFSALAPFGITFASLSSTQQANLLINSACNSDATCASAPIRVNTTVNSPGILAISGLEFDYVQPLDFLLEQQGLKGFGFTGNVTILEQHSTGAAPTIAQGVPPFTYNVTGYYENDGAMVRVSYVYNDRTYASGPGQNVCLPSTSFSPNCPNGLYFFSAARGQMDFSSSLKLSRVFGDLPSDPELTFDVQNVTDSKLRVYVQYTNAPHSFYDPGTLYLFGLRGTF